MGTIQLEARHNPLAWLLYFTKLRVVVDGTANRLPWGRSDIPVSAGAHTVEVSFGDMGSQRGPASITVPVAEGETVRLSYRMPSWMFAKGRLTTV